MKTILIDDEPFSLLFLQNLCMTIPEIQVEDTFTDAFSALAYLNNHSLDLIILDIEMPGLSGIDTAKKIKEINPDAGLIFITGHERYALSAFQLEAVSYILKPCSAEALQKAVERAIRLANAAKTNRISITTFGYFNVSIDHVPLHFTNSKAKELLALLVDRNGSALTLEQATDILWEGRPYDDSVKRLYRKAVSYLNNLFAKKQLSFFISNRGSCHILPDNADCDYFDFLNHKESGRSAFFGEYMTDYSWAEYTLGKLQNLSELNY